MSFVGYKDVVEDGDTVIFYRGHINMTPLVVKAGEQLHTRNGMWKHDDIIGQRYGSKVLSKSGYFAYILHPTPELWTLCLPHRTQIIYTPDISMILMYLHVKPGCTVVESGTGSASLSHAFARAVAPTGRLLTFDFHEQRVEAARQEMKDHKIDHLVTVTHRDVVGEGFGLTDVADAVFLDLPKPFDVVASAKQALKPTGGRFCSFSPCIEQVQRTCDKLRELGFTDIHTVESLIRPYRVQESAIPLCDFNTHLLPGASAAKGEGMDEDEGTRPAADEQEGEAEAAEAGSDDDAQGESPTDSPRPTKRTARGSDVDRASTPAGGRRKGPPKLHQKTTAMLTARPVEQMNGHTGYLTFAQLWHK